MRITFLGHAGLFIETEYGTILCDPWFNPAYFASWFPFPSNEDVDLTRIKEPTYLYLSHMHADHFDSRFLKNWVSKATTVLLPEYPLDLMERALRDLGFERFVRTRSGEAFELDGLRFMIPTLAAPNNGCQGDSGLAVDDGEVCIFDQNDFKFPDVEEIKNFGDYDAHFLQFSGAIWYPMVYEMPERAKKALGRKKRSTQLTRAVNYTRRVGATHVFPSAGPPCFLDDDLFHFNDFDNSPENTFPDQKVFLDLMRECGVSGGHLLLPNSTATIDATGCTVEHPLAHSQIEDIFRDKRAYLEAYKTRKQPEIEAWKRSLPAGRVKVLAPLQTWFEPLLEQANLHCLGIEARVLLDCGIEQVVVDFRRQRVYAWHGEECDHEFRIPPELLAHQIVNHETNWENGLFLSCRFSAKRRGAYNEYVYSFFRSLSPELLANSESYFAQTPQVRQMWECGNYLVQRKCPHLQADLTRFGEEKDGVLTCMVHGWQFDLKTGRCLDDRDLRIHAEPIGESPAEDANRD